MKRLKIALKSGTALSLCLWALVGGNNTFASTDQFTSRLACIDALKSFGMESPFTFLVFDRKPNSLTSFGKSFININTGYVHVLPGREQGKRGLYIFTNDNIYFQPLEPRPDPKGDPVRHTFQFNFPELSPRQPIYARYSDRVNYDGTESDTNYTDIGLTLESAPLFDRPMEVIKDPKSPAQIGESEELLDQKLIRVIRSIGRKPGALGALRSCRKMLNSKTNAAILDAIRNAEDQLEGGSGTPNDTAEKNSESSGKLSR